MIKQKKTNGFSLIEVMAGMVILSTGLLLLLPMMVTSIRANNYALNASQASMSIKDKMEDLKNMETPTSGADSSASAVRTWTVTTVNSNLYRLDVSVRWRDERGYSHRNTMTSYTANR
jgi:prepilin-type N-terminal cleavage/methylation domain-containing protein